MAFPPAGKSYGRNEKTVKESSGNGPSNSSKFVSGSLEGDKGIPSGIKSSSPPKKGGVVSGGEGDQGGYSNTNPKKAAPLD